MYRKANTNTNSTDKAILTAGAAFFPFLPRFCAFLPPSSPPPPLALKDSKSLAYCSLALAAFSSQT